MLLFGLISLIFNLLSVVSGMEKLVSPWLDQRFSFKKVLLFVHGISKSQTWLVFFFLFLIHIHPDSLLS